VSQVARKASKASLVKVLHRKGISIPKGATISELEERSKWLSGQGFLVRRFRPVKHAEHPVMLLNPQETTWLPHTKLTEEIILSKKVMLIGRCRDPPEGVALLDDPGEEE